MRIAGALLAVAALAAGPARALDPFEIQVYDGTANAPGAFGLELHLNGTPAGPRALAGPGLAPAGQGHVTFEPSLGVARGWELGGYVQFARLSDGSLRAAGLKLRSKLVTPEGWHPHLRLGVNLELSRVPAAFEAAVWGGELRPIVAWEDEAWLFAFNPIVGLAFGGDDRRPTFEPAAMAKRKLGAVAVGLEAYSSLGPAWAPQPVRGQEHYLFEALDLLGQGRLELNVAVGEGLTQTSSALVLKAIAGWTFE